VKKNFLKKKKPQTERPLGENLIKKEEEEEAEEK